MGVMTFEDAIAYSRNVVAAKVALRLGKTTAQASQRLFETWRKLGFGGHRHRRRQRGGRAS